MKKLRVIAAVLFLVCMVFATPSSAMINIDFGRAAGKISDFVTKVSENVQKVVEPIAEKYQTIKKGLKGAIESSEKIKKAKEFYKNTKEKIDDVKKTVDDAKQVVSDAKNTASGVLSDAKNAKDKAENAYKKAEDAKKQAEAVATLKESKDALTKLEKEQSDYVSAEKQRIDAQIKVLEDNNNTLSRMGEDEDAEFRKAQMEKNNASIAELESEKGAIERSEKYQSFEQQKSTAKEDIKLKEQEVEKLSQKALSKGKDLGSKAVDKLAGMLSGGDGGYGDAAENNFIAEGNPVGGDLLSQISNNRKKAAGEDTLNAYIDALRIKNNIESNEKTLDELKKSVIETDSQTGALLIETSGIRVQIMHILLDYIKLMSADLKMMTANDMINMPYEYQHKENFNFDDYIFTKKDAQGIKKSKKKLSVSGVKNAVSDIKSGIDSAKDTASSISGQF